MHYIMNRIHTLIHAFALIREDKLFSTIYVAGTAVAIASAMVIAIVFNMMLADIPPESHRSRTLYPYGVFTHPDETGALHPGFSYVALDSCLRRMKCVEAVAGIIPPMQNNFTIIGEEQAREGKSEPVFISAMATDPDFFRIYELDFISGRPFSEKEFRQSDRVCVITDKLAKKMEGETSVEIKGLPFHVVGVVKAVSAFLEEATADVYVPYMADSLFHPGFYAPCSLEGGKPSVSYCGNLFARILLRDGYTLQDFNAELEPLRKNYSAIVSSQMGEEIEWMVWTRTHFFHNIRFFRYDDYGKQGIAEGAMNLLPPALLMLLFLFLPAINLSGLVTNRMEARRPEMGVRKAFGAKRRGLLREVIGENLVLTLLGGAVGWVLSWLFILAIRDNKVFLQIFVSRDQNVVDTGLQFQMFFTPTLFLIVFLCCVVLNLMAALIPAWRSLRKPIVESLNQKR